MQFGPLTLKRCRYGWMLFTGPYIGKCFDLYGEYSETEVGMMRAFVRPGDTVLDIGANIGDLTVPLSQMAGPTGRIYAVESHPDVFNILCANLALNQIGNVIPLNAFMRASEGAAVKEEFVRKDRESKAVAIDELALDSCRLIKIDVDGNELDVLMSGAKTIAKLRPVLYFENDVREKSKDLLDYTLSLGYDLYWHKAPIIGANNFFGNTVNHWHPRTIVSLMMLGMPKEAGLAMEGLPKVQSADEWPV
ncbi:MAG: FkbM family methyltransferase [Alphaproteobacteria bacterium]